MVHLDALPGSPAFKGEFDLVLERARIDAGVLAEAGFDAILVENFGDSPYFSDDVPPSTVAAMSRCVAEASAACGLPVGVNVLRNDARAAISVSAATGAAFVRVNVLVGSMFTDQGLIEGRAAEVIRLRQALAPNTRIFADVFVKHAIPPSGLSLEQTAQETFGRAGADALIVSGIATGTPTDLSDIQRIRKAVPEAPLLIGSGVTPSTVKDLLAVADGVIVGTSIKRAGPSGPIDPQRAGQLVASAVG